MLTNQYLLISDVPIMNKWIYFILIVLSFALYGNTIPNDYALDDDNVVNQVYVQQGLAGIPNILTHRYGVQGDKVALDYRPVILSSFAIEYQFFKQSPHVSHFINVVLYALCLLVLYHLLTTLFRLQEIHPWLPFIITLVYAIHPLHTEVVASLKNRDELFGLLFGLLFIKYAFLSFSNTDKRGTHAAVAIFLLILTLTSKLIGVLYVPVLILILLFYKKLTLNKLHIGIITLMLAVTAAFVGITIIGLKREFYSFENSLVGVTDFGVIFATVFKTILYHIKMLLLPYPLRFYYGHNMFPISGPFDPAALLSFVLHLGLLIFGVLRFRKNDLLGLFMLCYLGCMALYANYPIPYVGMFSERALFLSSLWFISAGMILLFRFTVRQNGSKVKTIAVLLLIAVCSTYAFQTIQRNLFWKNKLTLMSHDIPVLENSVVANYIYANVLYKEATESKDSIYAIRMAETAATHYQKTIDLYPYYPDFFYKLGRLNRYQLKNTEKAKKLFEGLLVSDPYYTGANFELGKIYFERKQFTLSYPYFQKAFKTNNSDSLTLFYLAQNALAVGDLNTCYRVNKEFINLYPENKYPYLNLGVYYSTILKDDSAVIYFEKGIALGDRNPELLKNMVLYFNKKQQKEKADYYENMLLHP